jgi:site-specific recombinase XerD
MALLDAGVDISVIALSLGHESMEITNGYLHTSIAYTKRQKSYAKARCANLLP